MGTVIQVQNHRRCSYLELDMHGIFDLDSTVNKCQNVRGNTSPRYLHWRHTAQSHDPSIEDHHSLLGDGNSRRAMYLHTSLSIEASGSKYASARCAPNVLRCRMQLHSTDQHERPAKTEYALLQTEEAVTALPLRVLRNIVRTRISETRHSTRYRVDNGRQQQRKISKLYRELSGGRVAHAA